MAGQVPTGSLGINPILVPIVELVDGFYSASFH